jgi:hypothetical protein
MPSFRLVYRVHAIKRMFSRGISADDVYSVFTRGEVIETYPDDTPHPSRLILGWRNKRSIHIVVADNVKEKETIVISVYEPDPKQWEQDFRRRKP